MNVKVGHLKLQQNFNPFCRSAPLELSADLVDLTIIKNAKTLTCSRLLLTLAADKCGLLTLIHTCGIMKVVVSHFRLIAMHLLK